MAEKAEEKVPEVKEEEIVEIKEEKAEKKAKELAQRLCKARLKGCHEVSGPVPHMVYKLRRQYRWNVILKVKDIAGVSERLRQTLKGFRLSSGVRLAVDVDPQ